MKLTKEQVIAEHRKMWNWIVDEIEKLKCCVDIGMRKESYLEGSRYEKALAFNSFLCEYDSQFDDDCNHCPVSYSKENCDECIGGLYGRVCTAETWQEQADLARQIANLPEREEA